MTAAKRLVKESDTENLWRHEPPRPSASQEALRTVTERLGPIDRAYASFLSHADGWPAIMQDIDLFGSAELLGTRFDEARELVAALEPETLTASGLDPDALVPIGASRTSIDIFVMPQARGARLSPVVWIAGLEVERYVAFDDFFTGMIEHNLAEASDLRARR